MENKENIVFSNSFGTVTNKRIVLNYKSGSEDLPVGQITSVAYKHKRNYFLAVGSFILCLGGLIILISQLHIIGGAEVLLLLVFIVIALLSGIANWIGHHNICIGTGGKDRKPLKAEMSKTRDGRDFVEAVKKVVIK